MCPRMLQIRPFQTIHPAASLLLESPFLKKRFLVVQAVACGFHRYFFFFFLNNLEMPLDESLVVDKSIFQGGRHVSVGGTGVRPPACG